MAKRAADIAAESAASTSKTGRWATSARPRYCRGGEPQRALKTALAGRTSLVIVHRLSTIREADQILVIDQGQVRERGTWNPAGCCTGGSSGSPSLTWRYATAWPEGWPAT
jgi:hypothetical protein